MKDSKTILTRHLGASLLVQIVIMTLIALPTLQPLRQGIQDLTGIPAGALWVLLLALLIFINALMMKRIHRQIVVPNQELVNQTKLKSASFAFKKKSMNAEEDHLKHFIESLCLRSAELEEEITRMENEVARVSVLANTSPEEIEGLNRKLKNANAQLETLEDKLSAERTKAADLEKELLSTRRELKQSYRDYETLREEAETAPKAAPEGAPLSSMLAEKLRSPLKLINALSWRLSKSWEETPPAQIRDGLEEICKQSEEQLSLLEKYRDQEHEEDQGQAGRNAL